MVNKRLINTGEAAPAPFDPLQNFETVTYTGNGSTQKITGYIRKGAAFNGSSSYINLGDPTDGITTANYSISLWIKTTSTSQTYIISKYLTDGLNSTDIFRVRNLSDGTINFRTSLSTTPNSRDITSTSSVNNGVWNHVLITVTPSTSKLYINGSQEGGDSVVGTARAPSAVSRSVTVGRHDGGDNYFNGSIDQVRIFDKALDETNDGEVTTLYNEDYDSSTKSTTDIFGDGSGVALYELDEDASDTGGTYNGTPTNVNFLGMAFQPDLVWIKNRDDIVDHKLYDSVRGATKTLESSTTDAEGINANGLSSFDVNGFTVGGSNSVNGSGDGIVAWCWKAGGSVTPNNNTDGTITSTVSANQDAGFSIVSWTSNYSGNINESVGHGLNQAPDLYIVKKKNNTSQWYVYAQNLIGNNTLKLNTTDSISSNGWVSAPTATTFNAWDWSNGSQMITYCFHSVDGYQKVGSYTGNRPTDVVIDTGFAPRFVMIKSDASGEDWIIIDSARGDFSLYPSTSAAEEAYTGVSLTSTGFTVHNSGLSNTNGAKHIYLAIA